MEDNVVFLVLKSLIHFCTKNKIENDHLKKWMYNSCQGRIVCSSVYSNNTVFGAWREINQNMQSIHRLLVCDFLIDGIFSFKKIHMSDHWPVMGMLF